LEAKGHIVDQAVVKVCGPKLLLNVEICMEQFRIGDRVDIKGDTQSYILVDPTKIYSGVVIGVEEGQLLVRLDEAVARGPGRFRDVSIDVRTVVRSDKSNRP